MSQSKATRPAINYKLKDNPFFAAEQKDAKPPLAKINKSPVTQTTTSKLPKPSLSSSTTTTTSTTKDTSTRKNVRASVQRMAASSTVSANPWKAKMVKPSALSKKQTSDTNNNSTTTTTTSAGAAIEKPSSMSTAPSTTAKTITTTTLKSAVRRTPSSSSSTSSSSVTTPSPSTTTTTTKPSQQREDLARIKQKFATAGPSSRSIPSPSTTHNEDIKEKKEEKVTSTEKVLSVTDAPVIENKSTLEDDSTATSKDLTESLLKSLSVNDNPTPPSTTNMPVFIHPLDKSIPTKNSNGQLTTANRMMTDNSNSNDVTGEKHPRINSAMSHASSSSSSSSSANDSIFDEAKNTKNGILDKSSPLASTTNSSTTTFNSSSTSIEKPLASPSLPTLLPKERMATKKQDENGIKELGIGGGVAMSTSTSHTSGIRSVEREMKHNKEDDDDNDDDEPLGNKVTLANALQALRPTSQQSQVSISSLRSFSSADSSSSSDYGDNDDDEDDIQEINRGTSFSTPHTASSNIPGISKPEPTPITASSNTTSTSTTSTAFGITLPWSQYSHAHTLPTPDETTLSSKMMMADSAEIGRQLAVSHAALTAMEFPTLNGIMDAEKWRMKYSRARSKVDSIRDRVLLETNIQRAYSSMLKLAVDHHDRPLVMDIHARSSNIDQLTQELYYTFSHVCESQERYLHHLAGTLAITFQSEDRSWDTTTTAVPQNTTTMTTATFSPSSNNNKKRREDYPDVVLRLEKLAKKCSFSLTSKSNHHHDLFKRSITKSSATTISSTTRRHADSVSDDGNLSDDSMFHTSVRTSMTSFDDYQQAHALLDIIEKQLSIDNTMTYVAGDKSHDNGNAAVLEKELMQLREREADMQHRFDTQSAEFSRQRQEWENKLLQAKQQQPNNTSSSTFMRQQQQKLEQQLTLEVEAREASQKQLKEATLGQQELQKQLDRYRDEAYQAKQRESRLHDEQAALNRRVQELELEVMMATTEPSSSQKQHENRSMEPSSADNDKKISELNQSLLQANRREKELVQKIQELEKEIIYNNERYSSSALSIQQHNSDYQTLMQEKQSIQKELETSKQRENSTRDRLDTLHAQVNQALTKASAPSLDALVTLLLQQHPVSIASSTAPPTRGSSMAASKDNVQQELDQLHAAFKSAQEEYTRREAALMLQSASVEAELGAIFKEYDKLTRNITDFNHERKKYEQHVQALTREKHLLDKQLADFKVKDGIGKDGSTMTLRKEFRQLMAKVKAEHEQEIEKESEKRHQVEIELRNMKHELEMKRWDTVNTGVQTTFVAYPIN